MGELKFLSGHRHARTQLKKPVWIIILISFVILFLICAYVYPPKSSSACYIFSSGGCKVLSNWLPPVPVREFTDEEIISRVVIRDILSTPPIERRTPKIAFMFLSLGSLPFEMLWDRFFRVRLLYL